MNSKELESNAGTVTRGDVLAESLPYFDTAGCALSRAAVALLTGFVLGWLVIATKGYLGTVFRTPRAGGAVLAGCLLALALGMRLPHRLASWLAYVAWRRRFGRSTPAVGAGASGSALNPLVGGASNRQVRPWRQTGQADPAAGDAGGDSQLLWMILATSAMLAGLAIAVLPLALRGAAWMYGVAMDRFFWMPPHHIVLTMFIAFLGSVIPLSLIGVVLTCVNHVEHFDGHCGLGSLGWVLLGAGSGVAAIIVPIQSPLRPELLVLLASLPMFISAIVAVRQSKASGGVLDDTNAPTPAPELAPGVSWPIRLAAAAVTAAAAGVLIAWHRCQQLPFAATMPVEKIVPIMLWTSAIGAALASSAIRTAAFSTVGYAAVCVLAIVANVAGLWCFIAIGGQNDSITSLLRIILPCLGVAAAVHAHTCVQRAVLARASNHNATGASLAAETAWIPAVVLLITAIAHSYGPGIPSSIIG